MVNISGLRSILILLSLMPIALLSSAPGDDRFTKTGPTPEIIDTSLYASTIRYSISVGAAVPSGVFGNTGGVNSGYATTGPLINFEFLFPAIRSVFFTASITYNYNSADGDAFRSHGVPANASTIIGDWSFFWTLAGIRYEHRADDFMFYGAVNYGPVLVQSASVSLEYPYYSLSTSAINTRTAALRLEVGAYMDDLYTAGIQFYYTKPQLPANVLATRHAVQGSGTNMHFPDKYIYQQPISLLSCSAGFRF